VVKVVATVGLCCGVRSCCACMAEVKLLSFIKLIALQE
jgi:hypothetical protein